MCTSPLLQEPTDIVTSPLRCYDNYETCRYYPAKDKKNDQPDGLTKFFRERKKIGIYPAVNMINENVYSECKYFNLIKIDNGYVVRCEAIRRVLTLSQIKNCEKHWRTCPFFMYFG